MKKYLYPLMMLAALVTTACTNTTDDVINDDPKDKTPITFVGEESHGQITRAGFDADTKVAMRIKSTDGKSTKYTHLKATAKKQNSGEEYSDIALSAKRYWDDTYGRNSKLSVYAIAVPGVNDTESTTFENLLTKGEDTWFDEKEENETVSWGVTTDAQTEALINAEDLTYSNNISKDGKGGAMAYNYKDENYTDTLPGELIFRLKDNKLKDGPGKFDRGHLVFNHALCRITLNLTRGKGFGDGDKVFKFKDKTNVKILDVPTSGTLDLSTGKWPSKTNTDILKMASQNPSSDVDYSLKAQFLPDYVIIDGSDTSMLEFTIDNNTYKVTQDQMFDALNNATKDDKEKMKELKADHVTMEQGLNYVFNIKVNKADVNVTATLVGFADVKGELEPSNADVKLSFPNIDGSSYADFDLYRSVDNSAANAAEKISWGGDYEGPKGSEKWYFKDNLTYYHFRAVKSGTTVKKKDGENDVDDYFVIESGARDTKHDYHWAAPMKSDPSYKTSNGYTDCLYRAIGATKDEIKMADFHMMSDIIIKLETTDDNDKVTLKGSTVTISKFNANGKVLMGSGLVEVTGDADGTLGLTEVGDKGTEFSCSVVPQKLVRESGDDKYVSITIETADGNKYNIIKQLSTIEDSNKNTITDWLPGRTYTYTFTLKKTGIEKISAKVQEWIYVTADNKVITLE